MSTWVFGYGSLIYKPGFPYKSSVQGYIKNYKRVFWQGSTDHRGTPEAPGRTVTLDKCPDYRTWGVAYELDGDTQQQRKTLEYLEWREKQYDVREYVDVFGRADAGTPLVKDVLVYVATPNKETNVNYLGPAPLEEIAQQIAHAHGPSGPNYEYLYRLADSIREMEVDDPELFALEARVQTIRGDAATTPAKVDTVATVSIQAVAAGTQQA